MDASKYRSDQPSTDPANLILSSNSQQTYSSGWNAIQPRHESDARLPPISTNSPAFLLSDPRNPSSPSLLNCPHSIHESRHLSPPTFTGPKKPPTSAALATLADAAAAESSTPRRPSNAFADILGLGLNNTQVGVNTGPGVDGRYEDQLQSLTALITNSIKNSNGVSLEDSVKRALTQAVGTQRAGPQSRTNGSAAFQHRQILHPQNHVENGMVNDGQGEGAEDVMDDDEVVRGIDFLAGLYKKQRRQKKQRSSSRICTHCKKVLPRACDMNKHVKRHTRPFGCTFHKCNKVFGSKNDWKRHENSQHFQSEIFRCPVTESLKKYGVCAKIFYHPATFEEHLKDFHKITDAELLEDHKKNGRIGRGNHGRFWCGFCKKILPLKEVGVAAWDERFNHIDNHYKEGIRVDHWVDVETNQTKEEMILEAERREADREPQEIEDDTSSSSSADQIPSISVTRPPNEAKNPLKRKKPHDESSDTGNDYFYFCVRDRYPAFFNGFADD